MSDLKPRSMPIGAYAGIGSRHTPNDVLVLMRKIAARLTKLGWKLRSGGVHGADTAFERGAATVATEVFLPWPGFEGRFGVSERLSDPTPRAVEIAAQHHPAWASLSNPARKLIARDTHQVLGADCVSPSKFVLCWTPDGAVEKTAGKTGGTGQAIRIAAAYGIPAWNLKRPEHRATWEELVGSYAE
jgi:hypothetical protein